MSPEISERSFEEAIECALLQHGPDACAGHSTAVHETPTRYGETPAGGYRKRKPEDYDRTLCLLPRDVVDFVLATQPNEWKKLEQHHGAAVREQFLKRLASEIERRGAEVAAHFPRSSSASKRVTARSMMAARSPLGIRWRRRARARASLASSSLDAVNWTRKRCGAIGTTRAGA